MSDLDKLMKKLKTDDPKVEEPKAEVPTPEPTPTPAPVVAPTPEPTPAIDDDEDDEDEEETAEQEPNAEDKAEPIPANVDEQNPIEHEVALLQNDGVFRREMLVVEREKTDVLKVIAQTLLDIKTKLMGEDDGKKN